MSAKSEELPYKYGPDRNKRLLLHVKLLHDDHFVNVINVHFSYDRQQQCGNAAAVLDYIFSKHVNSKSYASCSYHLASIIHKRFAF